MPLHPGLPARPAAAASGSSSRCGERDFALLTAGSLVSLLGDGFFSVALAWQVYEISNVPTALSLVGAGLDPAARPLRPARRRLLRPLRPPLDDDRRRSGAGRRHRRARPPVDRRRDRAVARRGADRVRRAWATRSSTRPRPPSCPTWCRDEQLPQANALQGLVRPLMVRLIGPALGGFTVAGVGPGMAFLVDGSSFLVSAVAIAAHLDASKPRRWWAMGCGRRSPRSARGSPSCDATRGAGPRSSRRCSACSSSSARCRCCSRSWSRTGSAWGRRRSARSSPWAASAPSCAAIAVGPAGPATAAHHGHVRRLVGRRGALRRLWPDDLAVAGASSSALGTAALFEVGQIIWITLLQTLVPRELLGRVSSLDWLVSIGLVPVSFALTGPVAGAARAGSDHDRRRGCSARC